MEDSPRNGLVWQNRISRRAPPFPRTGCILVDALRLYIASDAAHAGVNMEQGTKATAAGPEIKVFALPGVGRPRNAPQPILHFGCHGAKDHSITDSRLTPNRSCLVAKW